MSSPAGTFVGCQLTQRVVQGLDMAHTFAFDHVYDAQSTQEEVYTNTAQCAVMSVLKVILSWDPIFSPAMSV